MRGASLTILLLLSTTFTLFSQVTIKGKLTTNSEAELGSSSVILFSNKNQKGLLTYCITNANGEFEIKVDHKLDSLYLQIRSIAFKDTTLRIANKSQSIVVPVTEQERLIDEVKVVARPMRSKGDTTTYLVKAFVQNNDESIGDVIGKMPGFNVKSNGQISYNGQEIQKYYIEGLDLLEGRYAIANKNIPHSDVGAVEVLHNHNPIKALKNTTHTNSTSINIKLKKGVAFTGRAKLGLGTSPAIGMVNISPMIFSKSQQIIASCQFNNVGEDLITQHQSLVVENGMINGLATYKPSYVYIPNIFKPDISREKYLNNRAWLVTYNHLFKVKPETEIKFNGSYYNDLITEEQISNTTYFLGDSTIAINERQKNKLYRNSAVINASILNNSKSKYIQNKISYAQFWDTDEASITNSSSMQSNIETPHLSLSNSLYMIIPFRNNSLTITSLIDHNNSPQQISFSPLNFLNTNHSSITQEIKNINTISDNNITYAVPIKRYFTLTSAINFATQNQNHRTQIIDNGIVIDDDSLKNSIHWEQLDMHLKEELRFENDMLTINLALPIKYINININDKLHSASAQKSNIFLSPKANITIRPTGGLKIYASGGYNESFSKPQQLLMGNVFVSHRSIRKNEGEIDIYKQFQYNAGTTYRNVMLGLFMSVDWLKISSTKNYMLNQELLDNGQFKYTTINKKNTTDVSSINSEISWYINSIKSTLGIKMGTSSNNMDYFLDSQIYTSKTSSHSIEPSAIINISKWWSANYTFYTNYIKSESNVALSKANANKHKINLLIYLKKEHIIMFSTELYSCKGWNKKESESIFSDIGYTFRPQKKQIKFELKLRNIFNTKSYVSVQESEYSVFQSEFFLRPRELFFSISINFGKKNKL